jgi:hypothetical protein
MAKALLGHLSSGADPRLVAELSRLRARVSELETEVARLRMLSIDADRRAAEKLARQRVLDDDVIVVPDTVAEAERVYS